MPLIQEIVFLTWCTSNDGPWYEAEAQTTVSNAVHAFGTSSPYSKPDVSCTYCEQEGHVAGGSCPSAADWEREHGVVHNYL